MCYETTKDISEIPKISGKSNGGQILRQKFINLYYENPNYCLECGLIIRIKCGQKPSSTKQKKFCSSVCSASYNNKKRNIKSTKRTCKYCKGIKSSTSKMCQKCRVKLKTLKIETKTKGELFLEAANWQSARSRIAAHARRVLSEKVDRSCRVCGYSLHVHCCHIKDVSTFNNDVLITEINSIDNLCWLCPNHHWEFDNKYISLD